MRGAPWERVGWEAGPRGMPGPGIWWSGGWSGRARWPGGQGARRSAEVQAELRHEDREGDRAGIGGAQRLVAEHAGAAEGRGDVGGRIGRLAGRGGGLDNRRGGIVAGERVGRGRARKGIRASTMVLSPTVAPPRRSTASMPASTASTIVRGEQPASSREDAAGGDQRAAPQGARGSPGGFVTRPRRRGPARCGLRRRRRARSSRRPRRPWSRRPCPGRGRRRRRSHRSGPARPPRGRRRARTGRAHRRSWSATRRDSSVDSESRRPRPPRRSHDGAGRRRAWRRGWKAGVSTGASQCCSELARQGTPGSATVRPCPGW